MSKCLLFTLALAAGTENSLAAADPVTFWNTAAGKALGIHSPDAVRDGHRQGRSIGRAVGKLLQALRKAPDNY